MIVKAMVIIARAMMPVLWVVFMVSLLASWVCG
jgi:hypothetical protein